MDFFVTLKMENVLLRKDEFGEEVLKCLEGYFGSDIGRIIVEELEYSDEDD